LPPIGRPARRAARPARVLVVDDNADAAAMLQEALAALGHDVRTARDGATALREADAFQPEIALLDLGLPGMDGYELAARLRAAGGTAPRLVAVTGYGQSEDRRRSDEAGFEAHLVKPVTLDDLQETLDRLIGGDR
ncbi:MAG TPA: response regulator, partial [Vicinamibacterales bacterium]|nr:response regulator [Vicinamibacterales bacterium]